MTKRAVFVLPAILVLFFMMGTIPAQASEASIPAYLESDLTQKAGLVSPMPTLEVTDDGHLVLIDVTKEGTRIKYLDASGSTVKSLPVSLPGSLATFCIDSKGAIRALVISDDGSKPSDAETTIGRSALTFGPDGKTIKTVSLGSITYTRKDPWYALDIAVDPKGTIYLATRRGIEVFSPQGTPERQLASYSCQGLDVDEEGKLYSVGYTTTSYQNILEKIDPASGKQVWRIDLGDMPLTMRLDRKGKIITVLDQRFVTRYSTDGKLVGRIFDMKTAALAGNTLYNASFAAAPAGDVYFIKRFPGAKDTDAWTFTFHRFMRSTQTVQPKNVLTISHGFWYDRYADAAISRFEKANPDWKVEYLKVLEQKDMESGDGYEQVFTGVATELMAGRGADIISMSLLPYRTFIDKGLLANLDTMAAADKTFDIRAYRKNVLDAFRYKGALYGFPVNYVQRLFFASGKVLDGSRLKIDDTRWTWQDFFTACDTVRKDQNGDGVPDWFALPAMDASDLFWNIMSGDVVDEFCDLERKTASFTDPRFSALLVAIKGFSERNAENNPVTFENWVDSCARGTAVLITNQLTGPLDPQTFGDLFKADPRLLSMPGKSGRGDSAWSTLIIGFNARSRKQGKAWELLKLLLADEIQQADNLFGFPINTRAYAQRVEMVRSVTAKGQMIGGFNGPGYTFKPLSDSDVALVESFVARIKRCDYSDRQLSNILNAELKDFFTGKRTADAVCQSLQKKVMTYLRE